MTVDPGSPPTSRPGSRCTRSSSPQVSSYGGFLTYQSKSFGVPSEGMTLMDRRPDVVLTVRDVA